MARQKDKTEKRDAVINVRVPRSIKKYWDDLANEKGVSLSDIINKILKKK